ncbi:MAG: Type 1 glutamine amidotransferase-like domain-containing protein [Clostridia bacterium]|nr:Type 1 glutamine amidotransferase-like domain-containing protein [Clostridia bacterium]
MICFLTSRMDDPDTGELNSANRFAEELRAHFPVSCRILYICSNPDGWEMTDFYASATKRMLEKAGFAFEQFRVLDGRNVNQATALVRESDLLILSGGHVPTQNRFFERIHLRDLMAIYKGVVIGISAGSMNSADVVYAQPEEEGEATDPAYQRFLTGLNLTKVCLLPHYQEIRDSLLDGLRLFEDITCADSMGRVFYAIPDGSYLFTGNGREELRGEAYRVKDGVISQVSSCDEVLLL